MPQWQMLSLHTAFHLSSYVLPRDPQKRLRPNKPLTRTAPCELVLSLRHGHGLCEERNYAIVAPQD